MSVWPEALPVTDALSTGEGALLPFRFMSTLAAWNPAGSPGLGRLSRSTRRSITMPTWCTVIPTAARRPKPHTGGIPGLRGSPGGSPAGRQSYGFQPECIQATGMLEEIQSGLHRNPPRRRRLFSRYRGNANLGGGGGGGGGGKKKKKKKKKKKFLVYILKNANHNLRLLHIQGDSVPADDTNDSVLCCWQKKKQRSIF